jgi:cytochrome c-type biogenesis protein CcmE
MTPRQNRMVLVALLVVTVAGGAWMLLQAFSENVAFYYTPTEALADPKSTERTLRLGGMVKQGSIQRADGSLTVAFTVTDFTKEIPVTYTGVTPDLFREGQGVIARGKLEQGVFKAEEVLAKHDENYMPPEMADKIKAEHGGQMPVSKPATSMTEQAQMRPE